MGIELWLKVTKWATELSRQKLIIFLFSIIISLLLWENYKQRDDYAKSDNRTNIRDNRNDSIISILNGRLQECNEKRQSDLEKSNLYWSKRYEELEKRLYEDYKTVKESKRRK